MQMIFGGFSFFKNVLDDSRQALICFASKIKIEEKT
jgi:hypothetical protein